ncbi:MAG: B12-binding domain-containing radical SAM protein [Candidatus Bathyarchaeia archaeon]
MKVLLVYPPTPTSIRETELTRKTELAPPLGVLYLASVAERAGHDVKVIDMRLKDEKPDEIRGYMASFQPDVVGISGMTTEYPFGFEIAKISKEVQPNVITVMGGPHVTFTATETLDENQDVDIVVRGEGESTFIELLEALDKASSLMEVKGVTFRRNGRTISTEPRQLIENLDHLPYPARHLVPLKDYTYISMITSRGCPYHCTFCTTTLMWGSRYRTRRPNSVVDEMQYIAENLGFRRITISDDNFALTRFEQRRYAMRS